MRMAEWLNGIVQGQEWVGMVWYGKMRSMGGIRKSPQEQPKDDKDNLLRTNKLFVIQIMYCILLFRIHCIFVLLYANKIFDLNFDCGQIFFIQFQFQFHFHFQKPFDLNLKYCYFLYMPE